MLPRWAMPLLAVLLVGVAPSVQADHTPQAVEVPDRTVEDPIEPLGEPGRLVLDVTVPCGDNETATAWTRASLVEAPAFLEFHPGAVANDTSEVCHDAGDTLTVGLPVAVGFDKRAPALQPVTATLEVAVQKNHTDGNTTRLDPVRTQVTAIPGYLNLYNVRMETKVAQAGPQEAVAFPIAIENYSNGPTRFTFSLSNPDGVPQGFQPVVPEPVVLESEATGGSKTSATVDFQVHTPFHNGYVNEVGAIQLQIDSAHAADTSYEGESTHVSTLTQARGFHVPGPGPLLVLAALAGLAVAAPRRRA